MVKILQNLIILFFIFTLSVDTVSATWWNTSYYETPLQINNTGNASVLTDFQVDVNVTYNSTTMDANFTSFHLINRTSGQELTGRFWINRSNSVNGSYFNIVVNLTSTTASGWDNTTFAIAHRNATEIDSSNGTGTFPIFNTGNTLSGWSSNGASVVNGKVQIAEGTENYFVSPIPVIRPSILEYTYAVLDIQKTNTLGLVKKNSSIYTWGEAGVYYHITSSNGLYTGYSGVVISIGGMDTQEHTSKIIWANTPSDTKFYQDDVPKAVPASGFPSETELYVYFGGVATATSTYINVYNIRVRKTTGLVDPTAQLGTTQTPPPSSINNLQNTTGNFYHNWTWVNPSDADFNYTMIYINGNFVTNVSNTTVFYNLTASAHNTSTISTHTVDNSSNINSTWVNHTSTIPNNLASVVNITLSPPSPSVTDNLTISMNGSDGEGDSLTKHYRWYKNGVLNNSWNDSTYVNYTNNFTTGDSIYVHGFVFDGYENSSELQSSSVVIGSTNTAPVLSGISLTPPTKKFNKTITVNTSSNITDTESTMVRLQVYRYVSGAKSYLGNSSWFAPPNNASVEITIPWSDGIAHTIYAQAQDNGNATQDNTTNLTSSEVSATFTSDITSPIVNSSSVSPSSVTVGSDVTISISADGKGANISTANLTITRPDLTVVTINMVCIYTSGDNSTCTRSYTANSGTGTYSIDRFGLSDDSGNSASPASILTFTATTASSGSSGGGGGGSTTIINVVAENTTTASPLLSLKNITSGATEPQLQEISKCLTESLFMQNKCSLYNYGVQIETTSWWVFSGAFLAAFGIVVMRGIQQDKTRDWFTEPLLYGIITILVVAILLSGANINMYILNFIIDSPKYTWSFLSMMMWGAIVALVGDNYYYGKKTYNILEIP